MGALALALIAVALAVAGCGGDEAKPDDAIRAYLKAIVKGDGGAACAQLTDELVKDIEGAAKTKCADVMSLARGLNAELSEQDVDDLEIEADEHGDQATATFRDPLAGRRETIKLKKEGGDWKIATLVTRPRP
jgi:Domain of unknown function (DUF4878)